MAANIAEPNYNQALAELLSRRLPRWDIKAQTTGSLQNHLLQPDIYVELPSGLPIVLECKYDSPVSNVPAVEKDALGRLGEVSKITGQSIEQSVAILYPSSLKTYTGPLRDALGSTEFKYAVFSGYQPSESFRFPKSGWIKGNINDLADFVENVAISEQKIQQALNHFTNAVNAAASRLIGIKPSPTSTLNKLGEVLHQEPGEQTTKMAVAILLNAMVFQSTVAAKYSEVSSLTQLAAKARREGRRLSQEDVLKSWQYIINEIDYWPIFAIAVDVLFSIDDETIAAAMLQSLAASAEQLAQLTAQTVQDLAGQIFGRLINDRKFLATFYTLPASATLLAELAIQRLGVNWKDSKAVKSLKIADFACGTGALLSAAYRQVSQRVRREGIDDKALHQTMMEDVLIGTDIMPAAVHITASMLSSVHPEIEYTSTRTHVMPYGRQQDKSIKIGSLHLLKTDDIDTLWGDGTLAVTGEGEDSSAHLSVAHKEVDLVIMNPPFTRPTNHKTAEAASVPVPSFAGFNTSEDEQKEMSKILKELYKNNKGQKAGHGNAGLASNFIDLALAKVKPNGAIALVLPATFASGDSWKGARELIAKMCCDICVVSIASFEKKSLSFSADTEIAEVLVIATRRAQTVMDDSYKTEKWCWANLNGRPQSPVAAVEIAKVLRSSQQDELEIGDSKIGIKCTAPFGISFEQISSVELIEIAMKIERETAFKYVLPRTGENISISICSLDDIGEKGTLSRDINEQKSDGTFRGPFTTKKLKGKVDYPIIWAHSQKKEKTLVVAPDTEGKVRKGMESKAIELWAKATKLHFPVEPRFTSQALAACITDEKSIGGRAWPSYLLHKKTSNQGQNISTPEEKMEWVYPVLLWSNTTLGLLSFWIHGTRQQSGRSVISFSRLPGLKVVDPRALNEKQLLEAKNIFEKFKSKEFLPANEAYHDQTRIDLDEAVFVRMLEQPAEILNWLAVVREKWCREPTVHGGKSTRLKI